MKSINAEAVICGAGIAGISAAYHLSVRQGIKDILLVDEGAPLSFTSDKSTECYRNWFPGPGKTMVHFMNHSIDLLEKLAEETDNYFHMNRRGYVFLTADSTRTSQLMQSAQEITQLGAGPLRVHQGGAEDPPYPACDPYDFSTNITGADMFLDPALIQKQYPFVSKDALAMLHVRRCGWFSAQQLGMHLLDQAKEKGVRLLKARVTDVTTKADRIESVRVGTDSGQITVSTRTFVNAAGPFMKEVGGMIGIDFPVVNELHAKISFEDPKGIIPRHVPLMIWEDPTELCWSEADRSALSESDETKWLLEKFPAGVHFRPEGGPDSRTILAIWTYDVEVREPVRSPAFSQEYGEIIVRGLARMIPDLSVYLDKMSPPKIDGGYYCKTPENRPLIGPLPISGAYVIAALSGFGIMAAMSAGELLAGHIVGGELPAYAPEFLLSRYEDPEYRKLLASWDSGSGQL